LPLLYTSRMKIRANSRTDIGEFKSIIPGLNSFKFLGYSIFKDYYPTAELQTKRWILRNLPEDGVFVDVGANVGILSACAALKAIHGKVISIEPTDTFNYLLKNLSKLPSPCATFEFLNLAIGNSTGQRKDQIYKIWGEKPVADVYQFKKLDDVVSELDLNRIDVIKIDTDGFELEVLKGAKNTILKFRPTLIVEVNEALATRGVSIQEIFDFMIEQRYTTAQILDGGNFILESNWKIGDIWPNSISISTDRERVLLHSKGKKLYEVLLPEVSHLLQGTTTSRNHNNSYIQGSVDTWAFAALYEILDPVGLPEKFLISVKGKNLSGEIGIAALNRDSSKFVSDEKYSIEPGDFDLLLNVDKYEGKIVIRSISQSKFKFEINSITFYEIEAVNTQAGFNIPQISHITPLDFFNNLNLGVREESLPKLFHSDDGFNMEQTSAHFLKTFYGAFRPKNHLEVGTWEGFGSELALNNGAEKVWSIEKYEKINPEYGSRYLEGTSNFEPGWIVSPKNQSRFTQLIGTSSDFLNSVTLPSFFDSILIDGAHDKESVIADTKFALHHSESGSIVIWDDYPVRPPDLNIARKGVLEAITFLLDELLDKFHLYQIRGTSLLIGVRK
jgi:FkbM family methyltransferase